MKWFIASDIHGSLTYAQKAVDSFAAEKADRMLLLGDILYHGPRNDLPEEYNPKAVAELLNSMKSKILCVRGNCDTEVDQMVLEFPILADYCIITEGKTAIYATHGHVYNSKNLPPIQNGDILLHGHTHVAGCTEFKNYTCLNPGSVSIPKENTGHGYMILENGKFIRKDFDGNICFTFRIQ